MGMFDDALKNAVPGGNLATPIAVAAGALILGKLFGGNSAPSPSAPPPPVPTSVPPGSVLGGLGDLIGKLTAGGAGQQVNSVGPVKIIRSSRDSSAARSVRARSMISPSAPAWTEQELLQQLALVLPQLVNSLTPKGRVPTAAELEQGSIPTRREPGVAPPEVGERRAGQPILHIVFGKSTARVSVFLKTVLSRLILARGPSCASSGSMRRPRTLRSRRVKPTPLDSGVKKLKFPVGLEESRR